MKFIKNLLKTIGIAILALLIISFFLPSKTHVERTATIKATPEVVFGLIDDLHKWEMWSPWHKIDPNMKLEYINSGIGKGAAYKWRSDNKNVGNGELSITNTIDNKEINTQMKFGNMGTSIGKFTLEPTSEGTKVNWSMESDVATMPFFMRPMAKYFGLFMNKMVGPDFEKGLKSLDSIASKMPKPIQSRVESVDLVDVPAMNCVSIESDCDTKDIGNKLGMLYMQLGATLTKNNCKMAGAPSASYPGFKPNCTHTKLIAMVAYSGDCKVCDNGVKCEKHAATKAVKAIYYGHYENDKMAYDKIMDWMKANKKQPNGEPWEEYVTDPVSASDYSQVQTNIYWAVK